MRKGFTLIELSIVLVIIGLIVGGVLTGQNLIAAAGVRATISQIGKYNTAVNTFRGKYGALPGDMNASIANQFGFVARVTAQGEGDGNGVLEGSVAGGMTNAGVSECAGELTVFWEDLSQARLIDDSFNTASETTCPVSAGNLTLTSIPSVYQFFPQAKIGRGNFINVWSGGPSWGNGINYFGLSAIYGVGGGGSPGSLPGLSVQEAYSIDSKIDDGRPQSGNVIADVPSGCGNYLYWAVGGPVCANAGYAGPNNTPTTAATPYSSINCYDNNNVAGPETYSLAQNAANINCALSFQFQ